MQHDSHLGLDAQRAKIEEVVAHRGWAPACIYQDVASGKSQKNRPMLAEALAALDAGLGNVLVVSKVDRLARSTLDFAQIIERAKKHGWKVLSLDAADVDPDTASGRMHLDILSVFASFERNLISERTIDALAQKRAEGVKLGRPRSLPAVIRRRIFCQHHYGDSLRSISQSLNNEQIPCARGGSKWWPTTVKKVLDGITEEERDQYLASLRS